MVQKDKELFLLINQSCANSFFDWLMPMMRESKNWIPLYILLVVFAVVKLKKKVWIWIIFAIVTIALTDQISSHLIKPFFARLRPCLDPNFSPKIRLLLDHCSGGFSFTSSHACNHFGIAIFIITSLATYLNNWKYLFIIWATIICFAQVYVGVHYPADVLCGGLLGALIGNLTVRFYLKKLTTNY
jgi:undecaprenyl-diphosphatase